LWLPRRGGQHEVGGGEAHEADQFDFHFGCGGVGVEVDLDEGSVGGRVDLVAHLVGTVEGRCAFPG
jgi:hypothetical protein